MSSFYKFDKRLEELAREAEALSSAAFLRVSDTEEYNQQKVLAAFTKHNLAYSHFEGTTGYGYGDRGREVLDEIWAEVFEAEEALVRHNFVNGTHAILTALFAVLRPGDTMVSLTGAVYDTLTQGIEGENNGSLRDFGVEFIKCELLRGNSIDWDSATPLLKSAKVAYLQRSRGYSDRGVLTIDDIEAAVIKIREINPLAVIVVDNCYGEFTEMREPSAVGADLVIGSLIKNPGGGIADTGGYIAGKAQYIEQAAFRLTTPGLGKEVGCTLDQTKKMVRGLFEAPRVTAAALKTSIFTVALMKLLGFVTSPQINSKRSDIITAVNFESEARAISFCKGIQMGSPVDSHLSPEPWDMPGYDDKVIMSAGAFTMGASIELSADAPMREPYTVFVQGGLNYYSAKAGVLIAVSEMIRTGALVLEDR